MRQKSPQDPLIVLSTRDGGREPCRALWLNGNAGESGSLHQSGEALVDVAGRPSRGQSLPGVGPVIVAELENQIFGPVVREGLEQVDPVNAVLHEDALNRRGEIGRPVGRVPRQILVVDR